MKVSTISHLALWTLVFSSASAAPTVCLSAPILNAEAGSVIEATIDGSLSGRRCEAIIKFSDPNFLDIHFGFESLECLGSLQLAEFTIPSESPNGDAFLLWYCTGQDSPMCNRIWITEGEDDLDSIVLDQNGTIACLVPTTTITTLATVTGTSTTVTEVVASTYFEEITPTASASRSASGSASRSTTGLTNGSTTELTNKSTTGSELTTGSATETTESAAGTTGSATESTPTMVSTLASSTASTTPSTSTASTLTPSLSFSVIAIGTSLTTSLLKNLSPASLTSTMTGGDGTCTSTAAVCAN